jgi:hypothetical protein
MNLLDSTLGWMRWWCLFLNWKVRTAHLIRIWGLISTVLIFEEDVELFEEKL